MKYIVLLRGINISGKNKISMSDLKRELEKFNFSNITTYLNSGNIILESNENKQELSNSIHKIIADRFCIDIPIFTINYNELKELLDNAPNWWGTNNKEVYDNIIFIIESFKAEDIVYELGELSDHVEKKQEYENHIFWSYDLKNYRKSNWWTKSAQLPVKDKITIRTASTIKKLLELCEK